MGTLQKKILLLLLSGLAMGLSTNPRTHLVILRELSKEWKEIDRQALRRSVNSLYKSRLIRGEKQKGKWSLTLTSKGNNIAHSLDIETMHINRPKQWDRKWRLVSFDIPEKFKKRREVIRMHLRMLGFAEFQKSIFILPWSCKNEIDYIVNFYYLRKYVRFVVAEFIDNESELRLHFGLSKT